MRELPLAEPGRPDDTTLASPARYLLWLIRKQGWLIVGGGTVGVVWMSCQALLPGVLGKAIDDGISRSDTDALIWWSVLLFLLGGISAAAGMLRHRFAVQNWLGTAYRTVQLITRQATHLGGTLPKRVSSGEVVSVGTADIEHVGNVAEAAGRFIGAVAALIIVTGILLGTSVPLGLMVLLGVPLILLALAPLLRPLHARQTNHRAQIGDLTTLGSDIVSGLRVLRGIGGEEAYLRRYRTASQDVRTAGVRVAVIEALLEGAQILVPGVFVVALVWFGARMVLDGELSLGSLVAFYGYAAFLTHPLRIITDYVHQVTRGLVAAGRTTRVLRLTPDLPDADSPAAAPVAGQADLADPDTGFNAPGGSLTVVASGSPEAASALADRIGRYEESAVTLGGVRLDTISRSELRERILVAHSDATLFTGLLRDELAPAGAPDAALEDALEVASATDILDGLPAGLDSEVAEAGRSFSGGQRQRLLLVRALLADPDVLVLDEPTSAVDAHTEARIGGRLRSARAGRTTIVMSTSPLMLDQAEHVVFLRDGKVAATGTHHDLLERDPDYRALVTREENA